jgi:hypothetical protein
MLVELKHPAMWRCADLEFLLKDCKKVNTFLKRIEQQAAMLYPEKDNETEDEKKLRFASVNMYKGEEFELFIEAAIRLNPCDKRVGPIKDYETVTRGDVGVDGFGIFGNGKKGTVQCKYRQHDHVLTANEDHLSNFVSASYGLYGVDPNPDSNGKCNMIIFTSGDSLNFFTDQQMFGGKVHCVARRDLQNLLDENKHFWEFFGESWRQSLANAKKPNSQIP